MEIVTVVLALLLAVLVSDWIHRFMPLPPPLIQIGLGVGLSEIPFLPSATLEPEIFFLVFLPPLLFIDGWRIPKRDLRRDGGTVAALALGLVLFTVVGIGYFIDWLIPSMPLAVAFALAAVLSPTDPIAVSAVAARTPIPRRLMHILEGEALLNDATGLVCLRFAIAAALTGTFSLKAATLSFLWLGLGGIAIGVAVTFALNYLETHVSRGKRDPGTQTLFSLLIPFAVYLIAEKAHTSGILAVAAAGIAMNYVENFGEAPATTRIRRTAVWDTVQLAANGSIFVLMGEQFPDISRHAFTIIVQGTKDTGWWLPIYVVVIFAALLALRFLWVAVSLKLVLLRASRNGQKPPKLSWPLLATTTVAGVKGAITLAGVLTLPLSLGSGSTFPARDLAVFLAMGVILLSICTASLALPSLLGRLKLPPESARDLEEERVREESGQAAMRAIERLKDAMVKGAETKEDADPSLFAEAADKAMERYSRRAEMTSGSDEERARSQAVLAAEKRLRLTGLRAERDALYRMRRRQEVEDSLLRRLVREVDLLEARFGVE